MRSNPGKPYFDKLSAKIDFTRDPLEKVYRLMELLKAIYKIDDMRGKLALKGGTALQFSFLDFNRLSVDVDFNYVGSLDKAEMEEDRKDIKEMLTRLFREYQYEIDRQIDHYSEAQNMLAYTNHGGNRDLLKVEINYSERLPVGDLNPIEMKHPFDALEDVEVITYSFEELMAQKTRALLTRGTPRDLFDVYQFSQTEIPYDEDLYRKLCIYYLLMPSIDIRTLTTGKIDAIDGRAKKANLAPLLKRREYAIDLEAMKAAGLAVVGPILVFSENEKQFLDKFYEEKVFDQALFEDGMKFEKDLGTHPIILFRLQN